ncbi:unnamed protein product [Paramecium primaurelia]|uniref:DNA polymerase beta palm domain-containing protein n=1 Tax=Paramecium primaurelia TaxID=5886 RepID=A0A8S1L9G8_PARPR|nr:unnamed protein product [Paramecium primaurelia]
MQNFGYWANKRCYLLFQRNQNSWGFEKELKFTQQKSISLFVFSGRFRIKDLKRRSYLNILDLQRLYKTIAYGFYRREKEAFGDMNILITMCDGKNTEDFLFNLIKQLEEKLLNYHFKMQNRTDHDCKTYMDIEKNRIDIQNCIQKNSMVVQFCNSLVLIVLIEARDCRVKKWKDVYKMKLRKEEVTLCEEEMDVYKILGLIYKPTKERSV